MSIFFDFDVGPTGRRFRRAVDGDKYDIELFWKREQTEPLFGPIDIAELIELSALSICMINENKDVVGIMVLSDHPNVAAVDPADWELWIRNMFNRYYLSRNTLFVHFMCCTDDVIDYFVDEAFVSIFDNDAYLKHIVLLVPTTCPQDKYLKYPIFKKRSIYKYAAKICCDSENTQYLLTAVRQEFCPKLKIRRAVEEDNDDIVDILDKSCPKLKELYGEYYISEIIGRHPEMNRKIIVVEDQERAAGVMCLNSEINYEKLQSTYELQPYHGLTKATPLEKEQKKRGNVLLSVFGEPIMLGKLGPFDRLSKLEKRLIEDIHSKENLVDHERKKSSKVNFNRRNSRRSMQELISTRFSDDMSDKMYADSPTQSQTSYSVIDLLEGDSFDYDIVNIDKSLLTIPEMQSSQQLSKDMTFWQRTRLSIIKTRRQSRSSVLKARKIEENASTAINGEPNAFMIELFGSREDIHARHSFDLLEAAFEAMKTYDYCLIRVPCADITIPLLQHFNYVPTKPDVCSKYALFIAHRSSVLSKLRVREADLADIPQIAQLLQNVDAKETLWTIEDNLTRERDNNAYVFLSGFTIIGVGILESPEQINYMRARYNVDSFHIHKYHVKGQTVGNGFATLKTVMAYPVFRAHYRFFARDIMRLSGTTALLWLTAYRNKWVAHKANTIASAMVPLVPRKSEVDCTVLSELKEINSLSKNIMAFSTWFIGKKLTSVPTAYVNTRIVVVGASSTTMAFLNTLLFSDSSSYLMFTNVTLISPHGLPYIRHSQHPAERMFSKFRCNSDKYLKSVPYTYYVNIVHGTVVEIKKQEKYVTLSNGSVYYYDMLFLLFGKQYQHPNYFRELLEWEEQLKSGKEPVYTRLDVPKLRDDMHFTTDDIPDNVFIVNDITDGNKALGFVKNLFWQNFDYTIIVYGASINAYSCLATLLEMNVPPQCIVFVEPFPPEDNKKPRIPVFCNEYVDQTIREMLSELNVTVYESCYFKSWTVDANHIVTHVEFLSHFKKIQLECSAFFYYGKRGINAQAYVAINKSGIGYDGGILIDHQFRTKDASVYAAGPATRYYRRYHAGAYRHKHYNSYEVGQKLGELIRNELDPLFSSKQCTSKKHTKNTYNNVSTSKSVSFDVTSIKTESSRSSGNANSNMIPEYDDDEVEKLPLFTRPVIMYYQLPGRLQYLDVRSPGEKLPHYYVQSLQHNGYIMETFKGGYFKLHLTNDHVVDGITCLSPEKYPLENFKNLYGKSAVVLNNVHLRYTAKKLDNFYEFFRSPWAFFLYVDQSDELLAMVKELYPKGSRNKRTLQDALCYLGDKLSDPSFGKNTKMILRENFEKTPHVEAITDYVIEWLTGNDVLLPLYSHPCHRAEYTHDLGRHPAFKKKKTNITKLLSKML
ncbi:cilia- and flagella-associated protein 61-like [Achroia grisella]|uniref:cilia- and flagella-associated protein 61-like n=1 Tax=Achroia grisella TaxID=688607 RepID=UPI0027D1ECE2|nr:cilia- and flagella-associated protein 61-like [Achroia grisella]